MNAFLVFLFALVVTMALTPPLVHLAPRLGLVDQPGPRKQHARPMPRVGGVAIVAGACGAAAFSRYGLPVAPYLAGMLVIAGFGVWDDRADLDYRLKLFGQGIASVVVIAAGGAVVTDVSPLLAVPPPEILAVAVTLLFLLAATNAVNLSDGLDGLAAGLSALSFGALVLLCQEARQFELLVLSLALLGSSLGFLRFNTHPARLFMGDAGSQFLGFSLGLVVLLVTQSPDAPYSPVLPLYLLGVAFLDTVLVVIRRLSMGRSPFKPDRNHLHHRLLALGFDHYEVVFTLYAVQALLVTGAFMLRFQSDLLLLAVYTGLALLLTASLTLAERCAISFAAPGPGRQHREERFWERQLASLLRGAVLVGLSGFSLFVAARADWDGASLVPLALVVVALLAGRVLHVLLAPALYMAMALVVYLFEFQLLQPAATQGANLYFFVMALLVVTGMRFSSGSGFEVTPLDFLLVFMALAIPALASPAVWGATGGRAVAETVLLIYASELVRSTPRGVRVMGLAVPLVLLGGFCISVAG